MCNPVDTGRKCTFCVKVPIQIPVVLPRPVQCIVMLYPLKIIKFSERMWIRNRFFTDSDLAFYFDADPDPDSVYCTNCDLLYDYDY